MIATAWGVQVVQALAVPTVILSVVLIFRVPLSAFLTNVAGRINKVSFAGVAVELVPARELRPDWSIDMQAVANTIYDVRQLSPASAFDSYADSLLAQFDDATPIDYLVIDLGSGSSWLSTRLFVFAELLGRMRDIKVLVFLHAAAGQDRQFLGLAAPAQVRWRLAQTHPELELALVEAYSTAFKGLASFGPGQTIIGSSNRVIVNSSGGLPRHNAAIVARHFLERLQTNDTPTDPTGWVKLTPPTPGPGTLAATTPPQALYERAHWLSATEIVGLLDQDLHTGAIHETDAADIDRVTQATEIIATTGDYIAVTRNRRFDRLVHRRAMLDRLAQRQVANQSI